VQRLSKIETDIQYISKHIEVINREHGEVCDRLEKIENRNLGVDISWKVLCKIGGYAITIITVTGIIIKILGG
jgi:cytochrome b subunit of formate dehydrogenase